MTKDSNGGGQDKRKRARALLDDLDSVKSLLGDAARDVPPAHLDDEDGAHVPTLEPEDGDSQIPLLGGQEKKPVADSQNGRDSVQRALSERQNPFLTQAQKAASVTKPPTTTPPSGAKAVLGEQEIKAMVDELMATWMPRIEKELRERLIAALRRHSKG